MRSRDIERTLQRRFHLRFCILGAHAGGIRNYWSRGRNTRTVCAPTDRPDSLNVAVTAALRSLSRDARKFSASASTECAVGGLMVNQTRTVRALVEFEFHWLLFAGGDRLVLYSAIRACETSSLL